MIFTVDGRVVKTLEELEHGKSYVTSSTEKFKAIDYANAAQPIWSFVSSKQLSNSPYYGGIRQTLPRVFIKTNIPDFKKSQVLRSQTNLFALELSQSFETG